MLSTLIRRLCSLVLSNRLLILTHTHRYVRLHAIFDVQVVALAMTYQFSQQSDRSDVAFVGLS